MFSDVVSICMLADKDFEAMYEGVLIWERLDVCLCT